MEECDFENVGIYYRLYSKEIKWSSIHRRSPISLVLELVVPLVIILALGAISKNFFRSTTKKYFPDKYQTNVPFNAFYDIVCGDNLVSRCVELCPSFGSCQPRYIGVAPKDSSISSAVTAAKNFVEFANGYTFPHSNSTFRYFSSEQAFIDTISNGLYSMDTSLPIYSSAVIFNNGFPQWDYTLRLNQSYSLDTGIF